MLAQLTPKERVGYALGIGVFLFFVGYIGAQNLKRPPDIVFEGGSQPGSVSTNGAAGGSALPAASNGVVVHVAGAVKTPGVVHLGPGSRVEDALNKCGGALPEADFEDLNLAAPLVDGSQLFVPSKLAAAEEDSPEVAAPYRGGSYVESTYSAKPKQNSSSSSGGTPAPASININTATGAELDRLPGVGPATAAKILEYRKQHGGFTSIDELMAVKGIGPKKLADMRKFVRL